MVDEAAVLKVCDIYDWDLGSYRSSHRLQGILLLLKFQNG